MMLRDAIDKEHFYLENISYTDNDLKAMSFDEMAAVDKEEIPDCSYRYLIKDL